MPRRRLVLLIEPDLAVQETHRVALEGLGYQVIATGDATEALALAREERPAVIIGDFPLEVPGVSLFTVAVRRDERLSDVFIINVTDRLLTEKDSIAWLLSDRVLAKPIDGERLAEEVARAMARKVVGLTKPLGLEPDLRGE